jgi:hypothetical protein
MSKEAKMTRRTKRLVAVVGSGAAMLLLAGAIKSLRAAPTEFELVSTIALSSTRDTPTAVTQADLMNASEV